MNIKIANRLSEIRKARRYSQEELAARIGVSRQAVSKWERGEASPDTDNLISLAKVYGLTLDDLLNVELPIEPKEEEEDKHEVRIDKEGLHIAQGDESVLINKNGIHAKDNRGMLYYKSWSHLARVHTLIAVIGFSFPFVGLIAYILTGVLWTVPSGIGWTFGWTFILDGLWLGSLIEAIRRKRFCSFSIPLFVTSVYVSYGLLASFYNWPNPWHPGWVIFLLIPVYYIVFSPIDKQIHRKD